jgi:hypothetical protein
MKRSLAMSVKITVQGALRDELKVIHGVESDKKVLKDILDDLYRRFPVLRDAICHENGSIRDDIYFNVDGTATDNLNEIAEHYIEIMVYMTGG